MSRSITFHTLSRLKRKARLSKKKYPHLSYNQRVNLECQHTLEMSYFCVRDKLKRYAYESFIPDGPGSTLGSCSYCGYMYCIDNPEDFEAHGNHHEKFEKAEHFLGFLPRSLHEIEADKSIAYDQINATNVLVDSISATLRLYRAYYERSLEASISRGDYRQHPSFEQYVAMLDDSNGLVPKETIAWFRDKYGTISDIIKPGTSYWKPKG